MPSPSSLPWNLAGPPRTPATQQPDAQQNGAGGRTGGFTVRPLVGVNIAFGSPTMTDQPLWVRIDDPGSNP